MPKRSLLIVDEDAYYAGIYANRFEQAGWKVWVEDNVANAKKRLKRCSPNVLIVELDSTGRVLEFLRELRIDPKTAKMYQIALVWLGDRQAMRQALQAGVDSYLLKGDFVPSEAVKKVKRLLEDQT